MVRFYVGHGWNDNARELDHVNGMDANARTNMAKCHGLFLGYVGGDDGGNDAAIINTNVTTLPAAY